MEPGDEERIFRSIRATYLLFHSIDRCVTIIVAFLAHTMISKYALPFLSSVTAVLLCVTVAYAGSLTPSASPAATSYTLTDIYTRLTTNATATAGDHDFAPDGAPAATLYTLTQIYNAIPTIEADRMLSGTSLLGVAGTYDIADLGAAVVRLGVAFGSGSTGTLTPDGGTATAAAVFTGSTVQLTGDWTLDVGTLTRACAVSTFDGTANLVPTAYDGAGNGANRWCITDSGTAVEGDILSGKIAWIDGVAVTGTMAAGYAYGDASAAYVLGTATASGTALVNLWNGTRTDGGFSGGSQAAGGVDDYNNGDPPAVDQYVSPAGWTACSVGNSYCGTGDSGADAKDNSTGLVWSLPCNGSACASFSDSSPLAYSWNNSNSNNGGRTASQICSDHAGWSLPHQKQLMQAYIDGSYGNLEASGVVRDNWSATTVSNSTTTAWYVYLSQGYTNYTAKTTAAYVRCVRPEM